jgi:RimJ/RimL family protein N-acetyltransferase
LLVGLEKPLETERLLLREFGLDDLAAFYELGTDPALTRFTGGVALKDMDEAREVLLARPLADYRKHGFGRWACVLKSSGRIIGFAGLKYLEDLGEVDLGYRLLPAYWGLGLATEASRAVLDHGFGPLGLEEIIGLVDPENRPSVRVLEKLGFRLLGMVEYELPQTAKYSIDSAQHRLSRGRPG